MPENSGKKRMYFKKNNILKHTVALGGAVLLTTSMAFPAFAATGMAYTAVKGESINIVNYLVMDEEANVPNYTFNFSIAGAGSSLLNNAAVTNEKVDSLQIYSGSDKTKVTGTPVIGTAAFSVGQTTYDSVQLLPESLGIQDNENAEKYTWNLDPVSDGSNDSIGQDPLSLFSDEKYARSLVSVNFSDVSFNEPGIYRYVITESKASGYALSYITNDKDDDRLMDVYVVQDPSNSKALIVEGYVLHNSDDDESDTTISKDGSNINDSDTKADGFVNYYNSSNLTIEKQVTGNQASRDEYFKVSVAIENAVANTEYYVDLSACDAKTKTNGINNESHDNTASLKKDSNGNVTLVVGNDGKATAEFWLQQGQSVTINGLAYTTKYKVNQDKETMLNEGYTVSITNDDDEAKITTADYVTDGTIDSDDEASRAAKSGLTSTEIDALDDGVNTVFTDKREGTIPTGVVASVIPGVAAIAIGGVGFVLLKTKRKEK